MAVDRTELDAAIRSRDLAQQKKDRLRGRLDLANAELERLESECRAKGINPADLDQVVETAKTKFTTAVQEFKTAVEIAHSELAKYTGEP